MSQVSDIRAAFARGELVPGIARFFGCDQSTIRGIVRGETYLNAGPLDVAPPPIPVAPDEDMSAIAVYRREKAKRDERLRSTKMLEAKADYAAMLQREAEQGRGGRPKNVKVINSVNVGKPGKPRLHLQREAIPDLTSGLSNFFGNGR